MFLHAQILPQKHFDTEQLPEEWKNIFLSPKWWKTRSFQDASQAWRLQSDTAMPSQSCRELQVHVCIFMSHMLTLFCLPQNKLLQSQKTHPHGAWGECLSLFSWLCAYPAERNWFGHCALVNTFTYTQWKLKKKWIPMYPHTKVFITLIPSE